MSGISPLVLRDARREDVPAIVRVGVALPSIAKP